MARTAVFSVAQARILDNDLAVESGRDAEFFWPRATVLVRFAEATTYTATTTCCASANAFNTSSDLAAATRGWGARSIFWGLSDPTRTYDGMDCGYANEAGSMRRRERR